MQYPTLSELPNSPSGKAGWPWTEESPQLPDTMPDGYPWPRISIVTPSYNQADYIEGTIRSVLLQGYPNLEYIIIDGGSNDGSVEIIRKYEPWLAFWVSERDCGQAHAINKGFQLATGDILAWLNSDDEYCARTLHFVARCFKKQPDLDLLFGDSDMIDTMGHAIDRIKGRPGDLAQLLARDFIPQPSAFFQRRAWKAVGGLDENLRFILDYELWIRMMLKGIKSKYISISLSRFRWHNVSKSSKYAMQFGLEYLSTLEKLFQNQQDERFKHIKLQGYHQAFYIITSGYLQETKEVKNRHDEIIQTLEMWVHHLEKYQRDYIQTPQIWANSLYRIGQNYCLFGHMREGRRFFWMALKANRMAYKAFIGLVIAFWGLKSFKFYTKGWQILFQSLRRLNQKFSSKDYEDRFYA